MMWEKRTNEQNINRNTRRAGHHRNDQHRNEPTFRIFNRARGDDGRHIAAKAHNHRNETLAMQSHMVHQSVHNKGRTRHIA